MHVSAFGARTCKMLSGDAVMQVFQQNKWRLRKQREAAAQAAAAAVPVS